MSGSRPLQRDGLWGLTVERVLSEGIWFDVVMDRFEEEGNGFGWRTCGKNIGERKIGRRVRMKCLDNQLREWLRCQNGMNK